MKTIRYILPAVALLLLLGSCYKDHGNYKYGERFAVEVSGIESTYACQSMTGVLEIEPQLSPENDEYDCFWGVCTQTTGIYTTPLDTISRERKLVYPVDLIPGQYVLAFMATHRETGVSVSKIMTLYVETEMTEGWYILKDDGGSSDIDLHNQYGVAANIFKTLDGSSLDGAGSSMYYNSYEYTMYNQETGKYERKTVLIAVSDRDMRVFGIYEGKVLRHFDELFYMVPPTRKSLRIYNGLYLINDGKAYSIPTSMSNNGMWGSPKSGDYMLSEISCGSSYGPLFYDELSSSFLTLDSFNSEMTWMSDEGTATQGELPPVNNLDADLLYAGTKNGRSMYALLKKKNSDMHLFYRMNQKQGYMPYTNPVTAVDTLSNDLKFLSADHRAASQDYNVIYFSTGNSIWSLNIEAGFTEKLQVSFPDGEEITSMQHLKLFYYTTVFSHLVVGTHKDGKYKVYLYNIQAEDLLPDPEVMEGEGRVVQTVYIDTKRGSTQLY